MKKLTILMVILIICAFAGLSDAAVKFRGFTALTGGGTGALDKEAIATLTDGDIGFVATTTHFYVYKFDAASTAAESSPTYIRPDDYATAGVWELITLYGAALEAGPSATPKIVFKDSDATDGDDNVTIEVNCTDTGSGSEDCDILIKTQTAGLLTTRMTIDGDGGITFNSSVTATGSFIIGSADLNETDLEKLDGITNGTQAANKAVVADANVNTGVSKVTELHIGTSGSETQVTATAAELNYNDITSLGTGAASKAVVLDGSGNYTAPAGTWNLGGATALEIPNSDDPSVTVEGQISFDTDGWLRVYSTSEKALARIQEEIHVTVYKPNDLDDAQRDHFWIWSNESGMSFIVTGWKGWSTGDNTTLAIDEEDADGQNDAEIDNTCEIATDGTSLYTGGESGKSVTIENGHLIYLNFDDTDTPAMVKIVVYGYYNADVN